MWHDRIFRPKKGDRKVSDMESHTVHYGYITDGEEVIDEVLLIVMRAPKDVYLRRCGGD